ncbi:uncharacterized protein LOC135194318 [Vanessa tameamea]|uniref:Uncharacterized protein LOC135194318 n=1 Tax=Vanessa tameamea TaxID=334116 RepID=A0ABM4AWN7_VANTA
MAGGSWRLAPRLVAAAGALGANIAQRWRAGWFLQAAVLRRGALGGTLRCAEMGGRSECSQRRLAATSVAGDSAQGGPGVPDGVIHRSRLAVRKPALGPRGRSQLELNWRVKAARAGGNRPLLREVQQWREEARHRLMDKWEDRLRVPDASGELVAAIRPMLRELFERHHGPLTYHLTQLITGHGCFAKYLCEMVGRDPPLRRRSRGHGRAHACRVPSLGGASRSPVHGL